MLRANLVETGRSAGRSRRGAPRGGTNPIELAPCRCDDILLLNTNIPVVIKKCEKNKDAGYGSREWTACMERLDPQERDEIVLLKGAKLLARGACGLVCWSRCVRAVKAVCAYSPPPWERNQPSAVAFWVQELVVLGRDKWVKRSVDTNTYSQRIATWLVPLALNSSCHKMERGGRGPVHLWSDSNHWVNSHSENENLSVAFGMERIRRYVPTRSKTPHTPTPYVWGGTISSTRPVPHIFLVQLIKSNFSFLQHVSLNLVRLVGFVMVLRTYGVGPPPAPGTTNCSCTQNASDQAFHPFVPSQVVPGAGGGSGAQFSGGSGAGTADIPFHRLTKQLSESQRNAVLQAMSQQLCCIQGPPGTGKTCTAAAIAVAHVLSSTRNRVLACADSNVAADNFFKAVCEMLGDPSASREKPTTVVRLGEGSQLAFEDRVYGSRNSSAYNDKSGDKLMKDAKVEGTILSGGIMIMAESSCCIGVEL